MQASDAEAVLKIYQQGMDTGHATFQIQAPSWEDWDRSHIPDLRYTALADGKVSGWVALTAVSSSCAYAGVAEVSVYVEESHRGKQIGYQLLQHLINESEAKGYWTLQAGIFPENKGSLSLHEKCGFKIVGTRQRIGKMKGVWRDTILLERRSSEVGTD